MSNRGVAALVIAAVVLAAGAAVVVSRGGAGGGGDSAPGVAAGELLLPRAREQMGRIARVRLKRGAVETVLEAKELDGKPAWVVASKHGYPAESERVRKLIGEVLDAPILEAKTAKPELYERVGVGDVDKPGAAGAMVELSDARGQVLGAVIVGNASQSPAAGEVSRPRYFVRRVGEAQSYLAAGNLSVVAEPMSWVVRTPYELDVQRVKSASITTGAPAGSTAAGDQVVSAGKALPEDPAWKFEHVPEGRAMKDEYAPTRVAQALAGVVIDDVAPASSVDMSSPEVVAQARTFDGLVISASSVTKEGKRWWAFSAAFEAPAEPKDDAARALVDAARAEAAEINKRHAAWVYVLPEYKVSALTTRWEDVLKPVEVPAPAAPGTIEPQPAPAAAEPPAAPVEAPKG